MSEGDVEVAVGNIQAEQSQCASQRRMEQTSCMPSHTENNFKMNRSEKEEQRMEANRIRAREVRKRKKLMIEDMQGKTARLTVENEMLRQRSIRNEEEIQELSKLIQTTQMSLQRTAPLNNLNPGAALLARSQLNSSLIGSSSVLGAAQNNFGSIFPPLDLSSMMFNNPASTLPNNSQWMQNVQRGIDLRSNRSQNSLPVVSSSSGGLQQLQSNDVSSTPTAAAEPTFQNNSTCGSSGTMSQLPFSK